MHRGDECQRDGSDDDGGGGALVGGQRVGGGEFWQLLAPVVITPQTKRHADGGEAEAVVKADVFLQDAGEERAEHPADVDGDVEDGESGIAARAPFVVFVERADHGAGGGFDAATAESDTDQPGNHAADAGDEGKGNVAEHDQHAGIKQGAFRAEDAVGTQPPKMVER